MNAKEMRARSAEDLASDLKDLYKAQFSLRMQIATQQSDKTANLSRLRREIARAHTILHEKGGSK